MADEALHASELSYRRLFEAARDGILILEFDTGRISDVNPFIVELLGYSHAEMVGKTVGELSPFKDNISNKAMLERLQRDGYVRYDDLPLKARDGRLIAVEFVSNVYQAGDKKVIQCNIRDITARKRAEAVLLEESPGEVARLRSSAAMELTSMFLLSLLVFGVSWYLDLLRPILDWIGRHQDAPFGEILLGLIFLVLGFLWFGARRWQASQDQIVQQRRVQEALRDMRVELETRVQQRTVELSRANASLQAEAAERQRAETELREREEQYRAVMEASADGIFVLVQNRFVLFNSASLKLFGVSQPNELLGRDVFDFIHSEFHEIIRGRIVQAGQQEQALPFLDQKLLRLDGSTVNAEARSTRFQFKGLPALLGSLKESVGKWRLRQFAEHVIQGYFPRFIGPKSVGFSEGQFDFVV